MLLHLIIQVALCMGYASFSTTLFCLCCLSLLLIAAAFSLVFLFALLYFLLFYLFKCICFAGLGNGLKCGIYLTKAEASGGSAWTFAQPCIDRSLMSFHSCLSFGTTIKIPDMIAHPEKRHPPTSRILTWILKSDLCHLQYDDIM